MMQFKKNIKLIKKIILISLFGFVFFIISCFLSTPEVRAELSANHKTCTEVDTGGRTCVDVSECKILSGSNQYFLLTQDVRSDDTCFFMKGDNNILDLNQYTITFGDLDVLDIPNFNFELGSGDVASSWNLGSSYNVKRVSTKEMSMIDDYVLKFATGSTPQEITSEYITLPATSAARTYEAYGIFRTAYLAKFTISAEDGSGNTVCTKTSNNLEPGPMIVCSFKTAGGQYKLRIKHEKRTDVTTDIGYVDYVGIKPAFNRAIALTTYCGSSNLNFPDRCSSGSASNILIKNGYIKQGRGKGIHSQGIFSDGDIGSIEVANVEIEVSGPDTQNIKSKTRGSIHDSHFINHAAWVENRQDIDNMPVVSWASEIYNNVFDGGQGSLSPGSGAIIHGNTFRPKTSVTNHYAITTWNDSNILIYNNKFEGVGPGILISSGSKNNKVYNNTFNITPQICDPEYISGTSSSAIRVTDYWEGTTSNNEFYNNTIYSFEDGNYIRQKLPGCTVGNFAFFTSSTGGNNRYYNNHIEIKGAGDLDNVRCDNGWGTGCPGGVYAIAFWISGNNDIFENNYVKADLYNAWIANTYKRASNNVFRSNTFVKGDNAYSGYRTMRMGWWQYSATGNIFIDTKLENGADIDDVYLTGDSAIKDFEVRWYLDVIAKNSTGGAVSDAVVRVYDKSNALAFEGATDTQGKARAELKEYYVLKDKTSPAQKTLYTPHTVSISKPGYNAFSQQITMDSSKQFSATLSSGSLQTCSVQGGNVCSLSQECSGSWIQASDTDKCCSVDCSTPPLPSPAPTPTPSPIPTSTPTPVPVLSPISKPINQMTAAELRARILEIQSFILYLQQEVSKQTGNEASSLTVSEIPATYKFTISLKYGQTSDDVRYLQIFLKSQGTEIYPKGLVTGYFGPLSREAVVKFQEKYAQEILAPWNLTRGTGVVGKTTRDKINQLLGR